MGITSDEIIAVIDLDHITILRMVVAYTTTPPAAAVIGVPGFGNEVDPFWMDLVPVNGSMRQPKLEVYTRPGSASVGRSWRFAFDGEHGFEDAQLVACGPLAPSKRSSSAFSSTQRELGRRESDRAPPRAGEARR